MSPHLETLNDCETKLSGASDILAMLGGLLMTIHGLDDLAAVRAVARAGRHIAEDWANILDVDAEALRNEAASLGEEVRP
jgi:hypothetical protein